jgi:hypothetical protein
MARQLRQRKDRRFTLRHAMGRLRAVFLLAVVLAAALFAAASFAADGGKRAAPPAHHGTEATTSPAIHRAGAARDTQSVVYRDFLVAIGAGLATSLALFGARAAWERIVYSRGQLTGYWLWVTYEPGDLEMQKPVWSVELLRLKHRHTRKEDEVDGAAWRVYDRDEEPRWSRRWTLTGWKIDDVLESVYKSSDPAGGHGVVHMWTTEGGYEGKYIRVTRSSNGGKPTHEPVLVMNEWARLPRQIPARLREALDNIPGYAVQNYPRRVRYELGLEEPFFARLSQGMAYALIPSGDNRFALLDEQRRKASEPGPPRGSSRWPIYRRDLGLGPPGDANGHASSDDDEGGAK